MASQLQPGGTIGFVGLGNMGRPMALRLAESGYALRLVDARPEVAREVAAETGGIALETMAALGPGLDAVVLMLPDGKTVRRLLIDDGLAHRLPRGSVVIDMGSCEPGGTA